MPRAELVCEVPVELCVRVSLGDLSPERARLRPSMVRNVRTALGPRGSKRAGREGHEEELVLHDAHEVRGEHVCESLK